MTRSQFALEPPLFCCCVCALPIHLESSKADEYGRAVHEDCYAREIIQRFRNGPPTEEWQHDEWIVA
jgi:hypothetical protein